MNKKLKKFQKIKNKKLHKLIFYNLLIIFYYIYLIFYIICN